MRSQAIVAPGQPLQEIVTETPEPQGKEVLLAVQNCGVCHSDLHLQEGFFDLGGGHKLPVPVIQNPPFVPGHEIQGTVLALGAEAQGVEIGKSYAVYPWIGCNQCTTCRNGNEHLCLRPRAIGTSVAGGYADHVLVPDARSLIATGGLDGGLAACYMCSGITALSALRKLEGETHSGPYLILGLGGVGQMALQIALALFDTPPLVADIDAQKLELALEQGAAGAYNLSDPAVFKQIRKDSAGGLAGLVDFVGSEKTVNPSVNIMRQGGKMVLVGLLGGAFATPIPLLIMKALKIQGSYVGSLQDARDIIDLAQSDKIKPIRITPRPLAEANQVLDSMRRGDIVGRVVLNP